jgi:rfaE bifunctional protein nucleotidyltransferase chain/domain/rfaE bifunctional protein kinase chain/domain
VNIVVIGDTLLDRDVHGSARRLAPDAPVPVLDQAGIDLRPGGAGLAAALAAADGHAVTLVSAFGADPAGSELRRHLRGAGVELVDLGLDGTTPEKIRFFSGEHPIMRLDRGDGVFAGGSLGASARAAIGWADAVLVSDYGRGVTASGPVREAIAEMAGRVPVVWDPHPRGAVPVRGLTVATPNQTEAAAFAPARPGAAEPADYAEVLRDAWDLDGVCVTCGARGAVLAREGVATAVLPAPAVPAADPCGAGDRFASRLAGALAEGRSLTDATAEAVAVSAEFVAAGGARRALRRGGPNIAVERQAGAAGHGARPADAAALAARVRAAGGTVVATGGCFDLLHTGHVSTLEAARALGDCLIVCLNSDASVRRLKGPTRPLVAERDRAAVLEALACVDAVAIFDEDTPAAVLETLRPHVWVKGGDYEGVRLPEADVLAEWGGRAYVLPSLEGHTTTRLIKEAVSHG